MKIWFLLCTARDLIVYFFSYFFIFFVYMKVFIIFIIASELKLHCDNIQYNGRVCMYGLSALCSERQSLYRKIRCSIIIAV